MNRFERNLGFKGEAKLKYLDGEVQVLTPGDFVRCAVTGRTIPLEELRYWSVELQEAYVDAATSLKRFIETHPEPASELDGELACLATVSMMWRPRLPSGNSMRSEAGASGTSARQGGAVVLRQPHPILLGGDQHGVVACRPFEQAPRPGARDSA